MKINSFRDLPREINQVLFFSVIALTIGMILGIYFIKLNSGTKPSTIIEHYNGSENTDNFNEMKMAKPLIQLVLTVHNHIISFVLIFTYVSILFYFVHSIGNRMKRFLMIEPFISILVTFGSMFLIRYIDPNFVFLMIFSSSVMYLSYFVMVFYILKSIRLAIKDV
jgi:hypothetical protein